MCCIYNEENCFAGQSLKLPCKTNDHIFVICIRKYVCKIDLKNLGIQESELLEGVEVVALPTIAEKMMDRETLMC